MSRSTKVISVSVPEAVAAEMERMAKEEGVSRSELVRLMLGSYKREKAEAEFLELQRLVSRKLRAAGVVTEEDVDLLAFEDR